MNTHTTERMSQDMRDLLDEHSPQLDVALTVLAAVCGQAQRDRATNNLANNAFDSLSALAQWRQDQ